MLMYHFVTRWRFDVPIDRVWEEAKNIEAYPSWWSDLKRAETRGVDRALKLGTVVDCEVRGALPYSLRFAVEVVEFEPPRLIAIKSSGDLVGEGRWALEEVGVGTTSTFNWDVGTTNPVLNLLGRLPFVRRMLERNHDDVMLKGYEIVKSRLKAP